MATKLTVKLLDPDHEVALSLDGNPANVGPWQSSPDFYTSPTGDDFEPGLYFVHERDTTTPDAVFPIVPVEYKAPTVPTPGDGTGIPGPAGADGKPGSKILTGNGSPKLIGDTVGVKDDAYLDVSTGDFYRRQNNLPNADVNAWLKVGNIKGADGATWYVFELNPSGAPGSFGKMNDLWLNSLNGAVWQRQNNDTSGAAANWKVVANIKGAKGDKGDRGDIGPAGPIGPIGPTGTAGQNGQNGILTISTTLVSGIPQWAPLVFLPNSTEGTYDDTAFDAGLSFWGANQKKHLSVTVGNRNGFFPYVFCQGDNFIAGALCAYQQDNATIIFARTAPGFNEISLTPIKANQSTFATAFQWQTTEPTGTKVYDSAIQQPDLEIGTVTYLRKLRPITDPDYIVTARENNEVGRTTIQQIADIIKAAPVVKVPTFTVLRHYEAIQTTVPPVVTTPDYVVYVQEATCDIVNGYIVDKNNVNVPQPIDLYRDNQKVATITAKNVRTDIASQYGGMATSLYGFEFIVPASFKDGKSHTWTVFAAGTTKEATYGGSHVTGICGGTTTPTTPAPYIVQKVIAGPTSLTEGAKRQWGITANYSDGSSSTYHGSDVTWTLVGLANGETITQETVTDSATVAITLTNLNSSHAATLRATFAGGGFAEATIQLTDVACVRPGGLTNVYLVWNYTTGGNLVHTFDTLDDANNRIGTYYNVANNGMTGISKFPGQLADFNVGTEVFLDWATNCDHVSDRIYALLDASNGDTIHKAIQVVNGRIAAEKDSAYSVPVTLQVTQIAYQQKGDNSDQNSSVFFRLSVAGERVEIRLRTRFATGEVNDWSAWFAPQYSPANGWNGFITYNYSASYTNEVQVRPINNPTVDQTQTVTIPNNNAGAVALTTLYSANT